MSKASCGGTMRISETKKWLLSCWMIKKQNKIVFQTNFKSVNIISQDLETLHNPNKSIVCNKLMSFRASTSNIENSPSWN